MKHSMIPITLLSVLLTACGGGSADNPAEVSQTEQTTDILQVDEQGNTQIRQNQLEEQLAEYPAEQLSAEEKDGLLLMREEEKLARDVYMALYNLHGLTIFNNISGSEQTHTDAIKTLLDKYGLADPSENQGIGEFSAEELQKIYNDLVDQGAPSLLAALKVGTLVEELDIHDLNTLESQLEENHDIALVYSNLKKGSRNHLRSFYRQVLAQGGLYTPVYLSQEEFDEIVNSPMERGPAQP